MRKVIFRGTNSLDNYFACLDESIDWIRQNDESAALMFSFWKRIDTVLWGRKTYELSLRHGQKAGFPGKQNFVFSRTLNSAEPAFTLVHEDASSLVRQLRQREGKDIYLMGGGDLARSLFEAGLIDEIGFTIQPILLGSGIPLFHPMSRQIDLEIIECKPFKNGCVYLSYRVKQ